jgi:hypothetical protein
MAFQRNKPAAIGVKAPFPGFIEPALATAIEKVPTGARWIHEIKFDGYRVQLRIANSDVKVFHPPRSRLDPALQASCRRGISDQRRLRARRRRHHGLLGAAERTASRPGS